jgi:glycosyltransferase involved in cell wall biosynthesis
MRITFVLPFNGLAGGVRVVAIYAQKLVERGHDVCVATAPKRRVTFKNRVTSLLRGRGWEVNKAARGRYFDHYHGHLLELERYAVRDEDLPDADVVVATWWETAEWVADLSPDKGAKAYFIQHYEAHPGQPKERVDSTWRLPMFRIVVSNWLAEFGERKFGPHRPVVVPNAVDLKQFSARPRDKQLVPTVGVMYSTIPYKGCAMSLEAVSKAREEVPKLHLVAFGAMEPTRELALPSQTQFHLRPAQREIARLYASCDAWLFGSVTEGFGLPILEAMACGTPVIGTPAGAAPELIAGGGGILIRPSNMKDMAAGIVRIARMGEDEWEAMSQAAHRTASSYTWDDAADRFERALERAAGQADSPGKDRESPHPARRTTAA